MHKTAERGSGGRGVVLKFPLVVNLMKGELASMGARRAMAAEFLGTLLFVFLAAGTMVVTGGILAERLSSARLLVVALAHAVAFAVFVAAAGPLSGGHLNQAITIATMATGRMNIARGAMYLVAQMLGAAIAAYLIRLVVPGAMQNGMGTTGLAPRVTPEAGFIVEAILTFALVVAYFATGTKAARPVAPLALGVMVLIGQLFALALTGASMNPARSFGPAFVAGAWAGHWIYWAGPIMGGLLAAVVWEWFFARKGDLEQLVLGGEDWRHAKPSR
jgi:aquaporin TIP